MRQRVLGPGGNSRDFCSDDLGWLDFGAVWDGTSIA